MIDLKKLNSVATLDSSWIKEADERIKNRDWLDKSARIALKVLRALKDKSMKQTDLAEALNVTPQQINKIIKEIPHLTLPFFHSSLFTFFTSRNYFIRPICKTGWQA